MSKIIGGGAGTASLDRNEDKIEFFDRSGYCLGRADEGEMLGKIAS